MTNSFNKKANIKKKMKHSCESKKKYASFEQASKSALSLNNNGIFVKPYECSICKAFHLTKRNKENVLNELFEKIHIERLLKN